MRKADSESPNGEGYPSATPGRPYVDACTVEDLRDIWDRHDKAVTGVRSLDDARNVAATGAIQRIADGGSAPPSLK